MQLVRKISPRTVFGSKGDVLTLVMSDKDKAHVLFRVYGTCNGTRKGESEQDGKVTEWLALLGSFEAVTASTGEIFQSGVLFLPKYVADLVAGQLSDEVPSVRFAFDITATYDEASATSYVYEATPLMQPKEDDPLRLMAAEFKTITAIEGPKVEKPAKENAKAK